MSAPLLWIGLPGSLAVFLLVFQNRERLVSLMGTLVTLSLAALAWWLPLQERFFIGPWTLTFLDSLSVFGRRFTLAGADRPALVILYLTSAFWFGAATVARPGRLFVPLGLGMVVLLTAAIAVEPFLYAALLIEMAVLVSIPFLITVGRPVGPGVLRYLTFQTLGMPFILITGWMMSGAEASPSELSLAPHASVLIGLGFAFLLAIFPFHTWIPMLAKEGHPYATTFVFLLLPGTISLLGLGFLDRFAWLRASENTFLILRTIGVVMVAIAGVWAAFQTHLERMLAYAIILDIGLSFIAIGLAQGGQAVTYLGLFFALLLPRGLSLGVWALALSVIKARFEDLSFRNVQGLGRIAPIACGSIILAHFSLAGLPLLASFPVRIAIMEGLSQVSLLGALWVLFGSLGMLVGGLRTMAVLVMGSEETSWQLTETWIQRIFLMAGVASLLIMGLVPHWFLPLFTRLPLAFEQLVP